MTKKTKRFFSLVLCAVMLCSLLPGIRANAAEITPDEYGNYHITSFEDLKALSSKTYSEYSRVLMDGEEELIISESLMIPKNLSLDLYDDTLTIPAGVTLTNYGTISADAINIAGTLDSKGNFYVEKALNITGSVKLDSYSSITGNTAVTGLDKITFGEYGNLDTIFDIYSADTAVKELKQVINSAKSEKNDKIRYTANLYTEEPVVLTENMTFPDNLDLSIYASNTVTVAKDVTLTLLGPSYLRSSLVVEGTLVNNLWINIFGDGSITLAKSGSYDGNGSLTVDKTEDIQDPADVLTGFDLNNFEVKLHQDGYERWELRDVTGLTKLPAPTGLAWGYSYQYRGSDELQKIALPGSVSWISTDGVEYEVAIYKDGEPYPVYETLASNYSDAELSIEGFCATDPESGKYYFTVTAMGDYQTTCSSDTVVSDFWTYTKPAAKIAAPTNPVWSWPNTNFTEPADKTNVGGYEVRILFSSEQYGDPEYAGSIWDYNPYSFEDYFQVWNYMVNQNGSGYYYFLVRSLSADLTAACNSDWSPASEAYYCATDYINPFTDVNMEEYYGEPILWALDFGITTGTSATTFEPNTNCTRGQIVTFLWRAAGYPMPTSNTNPFVDVAPTDYFYNAVLWAVENGITNGLDASHFGPNESCTRGQVATFLWRALGKPAYSGQNAFTDLEAGAYYYDAVLWAVENGITNGMGNGLFAPNNICTRGQIVTFLYRALA